MKLLAVGNDVNGAALRRALAEGDPSADAQDAHTREAALAAAEQTRFDAVLLDDCSPGLDSLQILHDLRSRGHDMPVVVLTNDNDLERSSGLLAAGAADCLPWANLAPAALTIVLRSSIRLAEAERRHREALRQNAFYAAIVSSTDDAIIGKSLDGTILSWNAGAERLYGYSASEIIGRNVSLLAPPDRLAELSDAMTRLRAGTRIKGLETIRVAKDGHRLEVALTISPISGPDGQLIGASTIARNITERKDAEHKLRVRADRENLINKIGQAALGSDDSASFQTTALALLGEHLAVDRCFYVLYDEPRNTARIEKDWCREGVPSLEGEWDLTERDAAVLDIYAQGNTEVVDDVAAARLPAGLVHLFLETGQRAYIAVPFFHHGRPVAALTVMMASTARAWSTEDAALVEAAAIQVRGAVEWSRARQRERENQVRQQTFLREVLASVTERRLILCQTPRDLPAPLTPLSGRIHLTRQAGLRDLRQQALGACQQAGLSDERCHDLVTAVSEAGMNAIVHGGEGTAQVCVQHDSGVVQTWITDHGKGIALENLPHATLKKGYTTAGTLGHGMKMMLQTADVTFLLTGDTGTTVVIEQGRQAAAPVF